MTDNISDDEIKAYDWYCKNVRGYTGTITRDKVHIVYTPTGEPYFTIIEVNAEAEQFMIMDRAGMFSPSGFKNKTFDPTKSDMYYFDPAYLCFKNKDGDFQAFFGPTNVIPKERAPECHKWLIQMLLKFYQELKIAFEND